MMLTQGRCIVCGAPGISDAYYCRECTLQEKDVRTRTLLDLLSVFADMIDETSLSVTVLQRDGCPKIINLGSARTDLFYERKKYGFKKR
jgi:PHD finger-like domain-containing protein 5A